MKVSRSTSILKQSRLWRPSITNDSPSEVRSNNISTLTSVFNGDILNNDDRSKIEMESPRNNILDSSNLYSALDQQDKLNNSTLFLPVIDEIVRRYSVTDTNNENRSHDLRKVARMHITDTNLAREKSTIEKSTNYLANHKLELKKGKKRTQQKPSSKMSAFKPDASVVEAVRESLPDITSVYKNEEGFLSRMNSFYAENYKRIDRYSMPFCEYTKEHLIHKKERRKSEAHDCVFCASNNPKGELVPENTFVGESKQSVQQKLISIKLPSLPTVQSSTKIESDRKEFNQAISALNPPERPKKTYFCDILGEKYCLGCIECHERRFAKRYEDKYMKNSDPIVLTMNLMMKRNHIKQS